MLSTLSLKRLAQLLMAWQSPLGKGRDQPVEVISLLVTKNVQYSVLWYLHAMGNAVAFE